MNKFNLSIDTKKNLLAFSGGVDSTALFYIMLECNIPFDIAIVDYGQRSQSKDEVIYATQLAHKYNKKCFISEFPKDKSFSEKSARDFRHSFFEEIILKENYEALLTAHQLNDKLEWFLMQLSKGAGLSELLGMELKSEKNGYLLLKPLLEFSKEELIKYLDDHNIKYFIDHTNNDEKYKRNFFRHNFADKLIKDYKDGIKNSFEYLKEDINSLMGEVNKKKYEELHIYDFNGRVKTAIRVIDKDLKQRGIIISKATRDEIKEKKELIISHKIAVSIQNNKIWIAPKCEKSMDKKFKERCRVKRIPKNIRAFLFEKGIDPLSF